MTTLQRDQKNCGVCGNPVEVTFIGSTNEFGSKDLDLRPPEMMRSTYVYWTTRCPHCGYCAEDIAKGGRNAVKVTQSDEYQQQLHDKSMPELANTFLCESMVLDAKRQTKAAGFACLHAAWACDDDNMPDAAKSCRLKAVALFEPLMAAEKTILDDSGADFILLADLLRRAGAFDFAAAACEKGLEKSTNPNIRRIIGFQHHLCGIRDEAAHTVKEAIEWQQPQENTRFT